MRVLSWNDDYYTVRKAAENTVAELQEMYAANPDIFTVANNRITVNLGTDSGSQKLMKSWFNTLPPEVKAKCRSSMQTGSELSMDLRELERLGFRHRRRFRGLAFFRRKVVC